MTRSVYILGGAGTGKSTFTEQLTANLKFGELESLYSRHNGRGTVHLRGHWLSPGDGVYLGVKREHHPGTDGLDWTSSPSGEQWLKEGYLPHYIIAEGATLSTKRFMTALAEETELMMILLEAPAEVVEQRFADRGTDQDRRFVSATVSRSLNMMSYMLTRSDLDMTCDTTDAEDWEFTLGFAKDFLGID